MGVGLTPVTRDEQFAAAQSGDLEASALPEAVTNVEKYLKYAAEHGGGGGGGDISSANVTAMTGYSKAETASAISTSDTLNAAVGKLEKGVDDNKTNISSIQDHIKFSANSKTYYLQPEQPQNPEDGDIWIG